MQNQQGVAIQFSTAPLGVKLIKTPLKKITYYNWNNAFNKIAAKITIMALTTYSRRNKAHNKGTKLAKTRRYLARRERHGVFLSLLRHAKIATPAKRSWREPLASTLRMLLCTLSCKLDTIRPCHIIATSRARSHLHSAELRPSHASFTARSSYLHLHGNSSSLVTNGSDYKYSS